MRTTTYSVITYDIDSHGLYVNPRGDEYPTWKEALQVYRRTKWYAQKNTVVDLCKTVWIHEDDEPYELGEIYTSELIYVKEIR